jgi:acyl-CoA synthetase (AMP-forming)/AMP-acid ligase II
VDAAQSALVTFTTGSSGTPKGADRTHGFLLAQHRALAAALGEIADGPELVTLPIFGLHALASGRTCLLAPISHAKPSRYNPKRLLRDICQYQPSSAAASPAVYETLMAFLERSGAQLDAVMHLHVGGAAVTPSFMARMRRTFPNAQLTAVYGSTEAEPIALLDGDTLAAHQDQGCSEQGLPVGYPYEGIKVQIIPAHAYAVAERTSEQWRRIALKPGKIGEICVAGDHVLARYYRQAAASDLQKIRVGDVVWHRTGDAGCWQADGSLSLYGPVAQSFAWDGRYWYPFPFELRLCTLPQVSKATLVCALDGPVVCVEAQGRETEQELRTAIETLALPFEWSLWLGQIPRDPRHNSKVDHKRLRILMEASTCIN